MKKTLWCSLATLGFVGRFYGSGTLATVLTLPLVYALSSVPLVWYGAVLAVTFFVAFKASNEASAYYRKHDPEEVVIDELLGCLITFIGIPVTWYSVVTGCILFRFFDISKCMGIRKCGNVRGAWGVLLDDVVAGVLSNLLLRILFVWSINL